MLHRIRLAMKAKGFVKMGGSGSEIETDECYMGGKDGNKHLSKRVQLRRFQNSVEMKGSSKLVTKTAVMGMLDRQQGKVHAQVVPAVNRRELRSAILNHVLPGSMIYTDQAGLYRSLPPTVTHEFVNHLKEYVRGRVHTNGIENFWSLLQRAVGGTYISVESFHLDRYLDEQVFRFNHRKDRRGNKTPDADRFSLAVEQIVGKRLTYAQLTGKVGETQN
jgi:transposase-like protein